MSVASGTGGPGNIGARSSVTAFARLWAAALAITWLWHAGDLVATRTTAGVLVDGSLPMARWWPLSVGQAWGLWAIVLAGAAFTATTRGWWMRLGILAAAGAALVLDLEEALNMKAYDRLLTWQALALLASTFGRPEDDDERPTSAAGFARFALMIVYAGLYGSTGWLKLIFEPAWWHGSPLQRFLVDTSFGLRPLGIFGSAHPTLLVPAGLMTVVFEALFPLLIWWRPARRVFLPIGVAIHLGIFALMNVGPFSIIAIAAYPALLGEMTGAR